MVIKKYTKQDLNNKKRQRRLDAYTQQAKVYRKTATKNSKSFSLFTKYALSALIPLAAANTLNAQCQGGTGVVTVSGSFSASRRIDVDGDGNDDFRIFKDGSYSRNTYTYTHTFGTTTRMSIRSRKALKIDPQNGWSIKGTFFEASRFGATTITRGQANFASNDIGILCESDQYGPNFGQFCGGNQTGFLAVRKGNPSTGLPGWIQIRVISLSQASASFEVLEMGIENSMGDNSATTGDCASLSNTLLPVELAYLESTPEDQSIRLNWETLSELNNTGFEVQRSTDGRHFSKIAWVEGQGTSNKNHLYSFKDEAVKVNTTYYYRLRQLDEDGTETFSPVRNTMIKDEGAFVVSELFPNPTSRSYGFAMFNLSVPSRGKVDMEVYNIQGQLIKSLSKDYVAGKNTISVPVNDLTEHQYFVKFQMGDEVVYRKLLMN